MSSTVKRLFEQFQPTNYTLEIAPDASAMRFHGHVIIRGKKTGRPSQRLTFHQKELTVKTATVSKIDKSGTTELSVERINNHNSYDEVRIHTTEQLYPGEYEIQLEFEGTISDPMHGLYPCYFEHDGQKKVLLATQFESHHAREVFPCIDEPEAKATFDVTLVTPPQHTVLGNTPVLQQELTENNLQKTTFETSPIMSTYLLAFVIGEMHCAEAKTADGITVRTWGTVAQPANTLQYATNEGVRILEFFTDYFQTPFPLKKCDQVALPDFESGAMENWGLITYREVALLTDPENRSLSGEQYVSLVVAHELSHQWFGNLVTMKWWDDLWLNESFASLMEHIALDALHPDWFQWEQYTAADVLSSSSRDVFKDVQSVHVTVKHPDEIGTLFDPAIVYAKGGRLLKMMREYIGDYAFRSALRTYFAKHAYKNTVGDDLWEAMSDASNKDIKSFMNPWLDQSGMPVIDVTHTPETIELSQQRFVLDSDNDSSIWPVPLLADQPLETDILSTATKTIARPSTKPVIFNKNGSGHMLVHYVDKETRNTVAQAFAEQTIAPESRINILNDMFLLARRGDAPLTDALDIVAQASNESRDAVWGIIGRTVGVSFGLTEGNEVIEKAIKQFRRKLIADWYQKLGWDDKPEDSANDIALRQTAISFMVASEDPDALAEAERRYNKAKNVEALPAEQRAMIVGSVVKFGKANIEALIEEYSTTPNPDVQLSICAGLTNTRDPETTKLLINRALGKDGFVRPQDIFRWYAYMMRNRYTRRETWEWLKANWDSLESMFGDSKSFEYFIVYSAGPINTTDWQKEFIDFFTPKMDIVALKRNIKIGLSEIEARVAWRNREEPKLIDYYQSYSS